MASTIDADERQEWSHRSAQIAEYTEILFDKLAAAHLPDEVIIGGTLNYLNQLIAAGYAELALDKLHELDLAALAELQRRDGPEEL